MSIRERGQVGANISRTRVMNIKKHRKQMAIAKRVKARTKRRVQMMEKQLPQQVTTLLGSGDPSRSFARKLSDMKLLVNNGIDEQTAMLAFLMWLTPLQRRRFVQRTIQNYKEVQDGGNA